MTVLMSKEAYRSYITLIDHLRIDGKIDLKTWQELVDAVDYLFE